MKKTIGIAISAIGGIMLAIMATCWNLFVWSEIYALCFNIYQRYIHGNRRLECGGSEYIWMLLLTILAIEIYALGSMMGDIKPMRALLERYSRKKS